MRDQTETGLQHIKHLIDEGYGDDIVMTPNDAMQAFTPQPIETAPKDGAHILLYGKQEGSLESPIGWCEGYWNGLTQWYHIIGLPCTPTHWLPLPDYPGLL